MFIIYQSTIYVTNRNIEIYTIYYHKDYETFYTLNESHAILFYITLNSY